MDDNFEVMIDFAIYQIFYKAVEKYGMDNIINLLVEQANDESIANYISILAFVDWAIKLKKVEVKEDGWKNELGRDFGEEAEGCGKGYGQKGAKYRICERPE